MTTALADLITRGGILLGRAIKNAAALGALSTAGRELFAELDREQVARLNHRLEMSTPAAPAMLATLLATIGCVGVELELIAILVAVELDPAARRLATYLANADADAAVTVGVAALALGNERVAELLAATALGAPLRRHRLIDVLDQPGTLGASARMRIAPRLLRALTSTAHSPALDPEVAMFAVAITPSATSPYGAAARKVISQRVDEVVAFMQRPTANPSPTDLVLHGAAGTGRGEIAREACRRHGVTALVVRTTALMAQPDAVAAAGALVREALLTGAQVVIEGWDDLRDDEPSQRVRGQLAASSAPLLLTATSNEPRPVATTRPLLRLEVGLPSADVREALWAEALPDIAAPEAASLYRVGVGAIARIATAARLRAQIRSRAVGRDELAASVRAEFETDLGALATRLAVHQSWDDLVLPEDTLRTIHELIAQHRHRSTVLGRWGFQKKLGRGTSTTALFSGGPGTGKSMVAGLIARELGLDLYQIDLSRVLSKWLGESEKQLGRLFDAAETGHVMLLFDEADALLGKRTVDPKSSNDRYANVETNYLLSRLEAFHGLAILTSNLESSIDPALSRRLSFDLRFSFPDEEQRATLWRQMLPAELPVADDLDLSQLAKRFELAGGHIRNVLLRAAYLAADAGVLTMAHVVRAAESEYADRGILVARGKLTR